MPEAESTQNHGPVISSIVAAASDGAIGRDTEMLWHLPDDFRWFKEKTTGHPIIMGRNTMISLGKALPKRTNIVITRNPENLLPGFVHAVSLEDAMQMAAAEDGEEIFITGGAQLYRSSMHLVQRLYLTRVHGAFPEANAHFHFQADAGWKRVYFDAHPADEKHALAFDFEIWERV